MDSLESCVWNWRDKSNRLIVECIVIQAYSREFSLEYLFSLKDFTKHINQ